MSKGKTEKLCRCGRGKIMTGRHSMFNYKDSKGRQVCGDCMMDTLLGPYRTKETDG